jgi:hypothetical protein
MKKQNSIDNLVENLAKQFSQIPNFNLTQDDEMGKKLFNFVVKNSAEITAFKNLFIQYYLPAAMKSSQDSQRELKFSKYKNLISVENIALRDNYYETIRLGYVGAFHKYESYLKDLIEVMNEFFRELDFENNFLDINEYSKKAFQIDIKKSINTFSISEKINWICNCVKHYDGYPIKEPIPARLNHFDKNVKIQIESTEFKSDLENLLAQNQLIMSTMFMIGFHQYFGQEFNQIKNQLKPENQEIEKVEKLRKDFEYVISGMFNKNIT